MQQRREPPAGTKKKQVPKNDKTPPRAPATRKAETPGKVVDKQATRPWVHALMIAFIAIVTFICLKPALDNKLLKTWDDSVYVIENKLYRDLSFENIAEIFSFGTEFQKVSNNYHPVTTLSLAINHRISGLDPQPYHMTNILLHVLNAILVYLFIYLVTGRKIWAALLAGLLFGIHPMHVESVAWVSERKDVLYGFFFIAGLILYYFHVKKKGLKYLAGAFLLFVLSVLSKGMAVVFPVIMILMDYLLQRKWSLRLALEKIPFFIISAIFGIIAVKVQSQGAINDWQTFTLYQRFIHASYGFLDYLCSFFAPFGLSAFYPYPFITENGELPLVFRLAPFIFLVVIGISVWSLFPKNRMIRVFGIGMMFYFVTVALVLQFLSVGKAITADRYTYIPYIGILLILGTWWSYLLEHKKTALKAAGLGLGLLFAGMSVVFATQTRQRSAVWHDDITLWTDVLDKYPDVRMNFIRVKRADEYFDKEEFRKAMSDYREIVALDPKDDNALGRIGQIYGQHLNMLDSSLFYLNRAYEIKPENLTLLKNLAVAYAIRGDNAKSLSFFLQAYGKDPSDSTLIKNIATNYLAIGNIEKSKEFENLLHRKK